MMSVSGHETLKDVERYTKVAKKAKLANSAVATLQTAKNQGAETAKRDSKLANMVQAVSQTSRQPTVFKTKIIGNGGVRGIRTPDTAFDRITV
jgi:hypothetical protein